MASVQTFVLPHYASYPVHVALFKDVTNATYLRSQLLEANPDFDYAFLDATMILSAQHLLSATFLALHAFLTSRQKTRTPHSELVFRLSPNNNIGESYKKFGLSDSTSTLIAVKLPLNTQGSLAEDISKESVSKHLGSQVEGKSLDIGAEGEELGMWCDLEKVSKVYKLDGHGSGGGKGKKAELANGGGGGPEKRKAIESVILGTIALKGS